MEKTDCFDLSKLQAEKGYVDENIGKSECLLLWNCEKTVKEICLRLLFFG